MTDQMITKIEQKMPEHPDNCQMKQLHAVPAAWIQEQCLQPEADQERSDMRKKHM